MSFLTKKLSGQVGIQESQTRLHKFSIPKQDNMLMIVEQTPRGLLDKIMTITPQNIHQKLGRKVGSMYFQSLYDAFELGVRQVSVLRIAGIDEVERQDILYNDTIKYDGVYKHNN